jgi:gliding motility-associated-like protein
VTDDGVATGNVSYTSDLNGDIIISGLDAGAYTSIIVTINNCSTADAGTYNLTDPSMPVFSVSGTDPTICAGNDGQLIISGLTANTVYDIDLTDDGIPTGNVSYTSDLNGNIFIAGLNAGVYAAITVTLNGCSTLDPVSIGLTDPNAPSPTIISTQDPSGCGTMDAEILLGNLDPNTTYDLDYNFNGSPIATVSITTNASGEFLLTGLDEGSYDAFTLTLAGCVGNDAGVYILAPVVPTIVQPNGAATYCEGQTINDLTASPNFGGTINWYDDAGLTNVVGTGNTFAIGGTTAGSYTYYVTETLNGCIGPDSTITVLIVAQPFIATSSDTSICNGDTIVIQIDSLSGGSQLTWSNGDTTMTSSVSPSSTTYFTIVVDDGLGCSATDSTLVTVNPSDDASFTLTDFCEGDVNAATNIVTTGGDFFFNPPVGDGALMDSVTAEISNGVGGTTYSAMYITSGICADSSTQNVTVNIVPPAPTVGTDTAYCEGETIVDLTATGTGGTISWYDDITMTNMVGNGSTLSPSISGNGTYTYYITESNGNCTSSMDSVELTINPNPIADFTPSPSSGIIPLNVTFSNGSTGSGLSYSWDLGDNTTSTDQDPTHSYATIGTFTATLYVTDINGCTDETSADIITNGVSVFVVPNIFTPNGDGINDELTVIYENIETFNGFIANRWGEILYEWKHIDAGWNGRTKGGVPVPSGTYFYVLTAKGSDQVEYNIKGSFHLGR